MARCLFGGSDGFDLQLQDRGDLVVIRSYRQGARHDVSPLSARSRSAESDLRPLFGFAAAGVGVYEAPEGAAQELSSTLNEDPTIRFAGRGLRDGFGAPVVYTENVFIKFADDLPRQDCERILQGSGLIVKRLLEYAPHAYFVSAPEGSGREVFERAEELLDRREVELCHPELLREHSTKGAFPDQWHLHRTEINGSEIDAHANVTAAWQASEGQGIVIAVIDDGADIDHEEFASPDKIVAPQSFSGPRSDDPRPSEGNNHGTACSGVACADGSRGASGVAPRARLMPIRMISGLGSQDEADSFVWAAQMGAHVISCSWGPPDGRWWDLEDPAHDRQVPLPDNTRLALDYATTEGRDKRGCVIVWAAGNGNESVDNDGYASFGSVIAVAACNDAGKRSLYSDYGQAIWCSFPSSHGERSLTSGIWTTDRSGREGYNAGDETLGDEEGDYCNSFGGTSSACPGVAGVAALVLSLNPDLAWHEVKDVIRESCDRIDEEAGDYDAEGHSTFYGYGRVNAETAVKLAQS